MDAVYEIRENSNRKSIFLKKSLEITCLRVRESCMIEAANDHH